MKKLLLFLLLTTIQLYAQEDEWMNLTCGNKVFSIVNIDNIIWIGTDGGLVKLDKTTEHITFYNHANTNIPDNHIISLARDNSGNLWMGSQYSGIGKFNGTTCQTINTKNSMLPIDQHNSVIEKDNNGNLWIGSLKYISKYDGKSWKTFETGNVLSTYISINEIKFEQSGIGWIGASWGLGKLSGDTLIQKYDSFDKEINAIQIDESNNIWIATHYDGLFKYDGKAFIQYSITSGIPSPNIYDLKFDSDGILWIATSQGLVSLDGDKWKVYNSQNSNLPDDVILSIEIDNDKTLWIGTMNNGLLKYDRTRWKKFNLCNSILPNYINDLKIDNKNNIWFGSYKGLIKFDGMNWTQYDTSNSGLRQSHQGNIDVQALECDFNDNLWIGLRGAPWLAKYDGKTWINYDSTNSPLSAGTVSSLKCDHDNNLWIGTSGSGLVKLSNGDWQTYNAQNSPLTCNIISDIEIDSKKQLWVGLREQFFRDNDGSKIIYNGGLAKFDGATWEIYQKENSGLPYNNIGAITVDIDGAIWISVPDPSAAGVEYGYGLAKFDGADWTIFNIYNSPLTSNTIFDISTDKENNLWLTTCGGGLVKFDRKDNWKVYNLLNSGIASDIQSVVKIDSHGTKWITHPWSGISIFREGGVGLSDVNEKIDKSIPANFQLNQNYPNPFNPETTINYQLPTSGFVTLKIYDLFGREVATLVNEYKNAGSYNSRFSVRNYHLASGIYFYRLQSGSNSDTKKLILMK